MTVFPEDEKETKHEEDSERAVQRRVQMQFARIRYRYFRPEIGTVAGLSPHFENEGSFPIIRGSDDLPMRYTDIWHGLGQDYEYVKFLEEQMQPEKFEIDVPDTLLNFDEGKEPTVKLSALFKKGSIFAGVVALISFITWIVSNIIILGPFLAALVILSAPLFYLMGVRIERGYLVVRRSCA